jgi:hypothetical protein
MDNFEALNIILFKRRRMFFYKSIHIKTFYPLVNDVGKSLTAINLIISR